MKGFIENREMEQLYDFLMGLDEVFNTVKTQILTTKPTPSLGTTYHLVLEDEKRRDITTTIRPNNNEAAAFQVQNRNRNQHTDRKEKVACARCGRTNHRLEDCYLIVGYPKRKEDFSAKEVGKRHVTARNESWKKTNRAAHVKQSPIEGISNEDFALMARYFREQVKEESNEELPTVNMAGNIPSNSPWIIDSGASEHISCEEGALNSTHMKTEMTVTIPNGKRIPVKGIGSITLPNGLKIDNVFKIPDFKCNLLSVSKLTKNLTSSLHFYPNFCYMQDLHSRKLIGMGKERDGLYYLEPIQNSNMAFASTSSETWHRRLGHASKEKLQHICSFNDFCDS